LTKRNKTAEALILYITGCTGGFMVILSVGITEYGYINILNDVTLVIGLALFMATLGYGFFCIIRDIKN